ncbi:MAG: ATP-binding protein [Ketobacter sp.]
MPLSLRTLNIKQKLTLVMMLTICAVVVLIGVFFLAYERIQTRDQMEHEIKVVTKVAYSQIVAALDFNDLSTLSESANSLDYDDTIDMVCLYSASMALIVRSRPSELDLEPCPEQPGAVKRGFHGDKYYFMDEVVSDASQVGVIFIRANTDYMESLIQQYFYMMLTALVVIAVASIGIAMILQKAVTRPISELADTAANITANSDYSVRAAKHSDDELGQMVDGFNAMLNAIELRDLELRNHKAHLETKVEERTAELKSANQELEAFSYSVSHDLRSPLRAIDGFSQALLEDYAESLDPMAMSYLERVRMASQRMGGLIDSMLRLSRVSRHELVLQPTDIAKQCLEIIEELRERDPARKVTVEVQDDMLAQCDSTLMRIVLTNLIDNAWKYSHKHSAPEIAIGKKQNAFFVRDNGAGFDMRYADKLFGAFQRLHGKDEFEGTGIGLATVARIIHRHGGDIWAESAVDHGATFYFTLPV